MHKEDEGRRGAGGEGPVPRRVYIRARSTSKALLMRRGTAIRDEALAQIEIEFFQSETQIRPGRYLTSTQLVVSRPHTNSPQLPRVDPDSHHPPQQQALEVLRHMLRQRDEGALLGYLSSQRKYLPNGEFRMFPMGLTPRDVRYLLAVPFPSSSFLGGPNDMDGNGNVNDTRGFGTASKLRERPDTDTTQDVVDADGSQPTSARPARPQIQAQGITRYLPALS
ncbi:hypothetical protein DER46DRAFT_575332 [Fusarium sp. MPI-SDFR-AT-0072]|nr:hypothetical protein DER46DRAFT_575332 [Fusarium sp. MPI-SDFR-AT-0072]